MSSFINRHVEMSSFINAVLVVPFSSKNGPNTSKKGGF